MLSETEAIAQIKQTLLEHGKITHATIKPVRLSYWNNLTIRVMSTERKVTRDWLMEKYGAGKWPAWMEDYPGGVPSWVTYYCFDPANPLVAPILAAHKGDWWRISLAIRD